MTILVTGATGSVGRLVVDELVKAGQPVRALTIDPARAALPDHVDVVKGNILRPETLAGAFDGIERMYLAPAPETAADVAGLAVRSGVRYIVDLSGEPGSWWYDVAAAVERSGAAWTHLWAGEFMENSLIWAEQVRTTGMVRDSHPGAANEPIAMADIAAVAATLLRAGGHEGRAYPLLGPETITSAERVRCIAAALGREIPFVEISREEAIEQLTPAMGEYAEWYVDGRAELVPGAEPPAVAPATSVVPEITGRPATTFAEWAVQNAPEFS